MGMCLVVCYKVQLSADCGSSLDEMVFGLFDSLIYRISKAYCSFSS
jgi:hypothetical protein